MCFCDSGQQPLHWNVMLEGHTPMRSACQYEKEAGCDDTERAAAIFAEREPSVCAALRVCGDLIGLSCAANLCVIQSRGRQSIKRQNVQWSHAERTVPSG
ncbi:hypothetical protein GDO78_008645 [Eleutherodactylus coqui]|uniref:Uncharacterized protein n=1 Tax=Eleutherodactylus coqui TaxID=57060 RepID=A0A8J6KB00_ELECQ|nr:hypothetical protein GDO78_008645 [Eleutherodactylus coqui]